MELRQVVKSSQTASVLQAVASPEVDKRPVVSERCEGSVVLALESEGRSGLNRHYRCRSLLRFLSPLLHRPLPSPQPLSSAFILYPYFLFEGAPTRLLRSSWSRPPPTTDRLRAWTGNEPWIEPRGRGQDLGKRRSGEMIKPLMNVMFCCLFFPNIIGFEWILAIWNPSTHERT